MPMNRLVVNSEVMNYVYRQPVHIKKLAPYRTDGRLFRTDVFSNFKVT